MSRPLISMDGVYAGDVGNSTSNELNTMVRYKAILVDKSAYLMELSRYVVLNPVRAKMVKSPDEWPWSSYCYTTGLFGSPAWLATDAKLHYFGSDRDETILRFARFVAEGVGVNVCAN